MAELTLGPKTFPTKAHASAWLKDLKDQEEGTLYLASKDQSTYNALVAALDRHPDRALYPQAWPTHFSVTLCPVYRQNRLTAHWVLVAGDLLWRFSYLRCISPVPHRHKVRRAFLNEVLHQLGSAQTATKRQLVHTNDLDLLIEVFLELQKVPKDKRTPKELLKKDSLLLKDRALAALWREYHEKNAQLKALTCDEYVLYVKNETEDILLGVNP